jgi:hypothetical protein
MSTGANLYVDPAANAAWAAAAQRMYNQTPRSVESVLQLAALSYVQSGRKETPAARKGAKRRTQRRYADLTRPDAGNMRGMRFVSFAPGMDPKRMPVRDYWVLAQRRPAEVVTIPDMPENAGLMREYEVVPNVKAAKNSWYGIMRSLGKVIGAMGTMPKGRVAYAIRHKLGGDPAITIINRLSYLLKIAPNVDSVAKRRAAKQIMTRLDKLPAKGWK